MVLSAAVALPLFMGAAGDLTVNSSDTTITANVDTPTITVTVQNTNSTTDSDGNAQDSSEDYTISVSLSGNIELANANPDSTDDVACSGSPGDTSFSCDQFTLDNDSDTTDVPNTATITFAVEGTEEGSGTVTVSLDGSAGTDASEEVDITIEPEEVSELTLSSSCAADGAQVFVGDSCTLEVAATYEGGDVENVSSEATFTGYAGIGTLSENVLEITDDGTATITANFDGKDSNTITILAIEALTASGVSLDGEVIRHVPLRTAGGISRVYSLDEPIALNDEIATPNAVASYDRLVFSANVIDEPDTLEWRLETPELGSLQNFATGEMCDGSHAPADDAVASGSLALVADVSANGASVDGGSVRPDTTLTYTLTVTNTGTADLADLTLTDALTLDGAAINIIPSVTQGNFACTASEGALSCTLASLAGGASEVVEYTIAPGGSGSFASAASVVTDDTAETSEATDGTAVSLDPADGPIVCRGVSRVEFIAGQYQGTAVIEVARVASDTDSTAVELDRFSVHILPPATSELEILDASGTSAITTDIEIPVGETGSFSARRTLEDGSSEISFEGLAWEFRSGSSSEWTESSEIVSVSGGAVEALAEGVVFMRLVREEEEATPGTTELRAQERRIISEEISVRVTESAPTITDLYTAGSSNAVRGGTEEVFVRIRHFEGLDLADIELVLIAGSYASATDIPAGSKIYAVEILEDEAIIPEADDADAANTALFQIPFRIPDLTELRDGEYTIRVSVSSASAQSADQAVTGITIGSAEEGDLNLSGEITLADGVLALQLRDGTTGETGETLSRMEGNLDLDGDSEIEEAEVAQVMDLVISEFLNR